MLVKRNSPNLILPLHSGGRGRVEGFVQIGGVEWGSAHPNIAPYDRYAAADGEVFLGVVNNGQFKRFCECVSRPDLASDPRFSESSLRLTNRDALRAEIERTLVNVPAAALCDDLMRRGVPAGQVNDVAQALSQPHAVHRGMVVDQQGHRSLGLPVKLSTNPGCADTLPPRLSEHAGAILSELGYDAAAIESPRPASSLNCRKLLTADQASVTLSKTLPMPVRASSGTTLR